MEIVRTVLALLRRPKALVPVLLLTLGLGAAAYVLVPVHYTSKEVLVLTSPASGAIGSSRRPRFNPLLNFDQGLLTTASMLVQAMKSPDVAGLVGASKATTFTVNDANGSADLFGARGPFLEVVVSGDSADAAYQTIQAVGALIRTQLAEQQKSLQSPESKYIVVADVVPPTYPQLYIVPTLKAVTFGLLAGLLCGLGCAYAVHRLRERSRMQSAEDLAPQAQAVTNGYGGGVASAVPTLAVNLSGRESGR